MLAWQGASEFKPAPSQESCWCACQRRSAAQRPAQGTTTAHIDLWREDQHWRGRSSLTLLLAQVDLNNLCRLKSLAGLDSSLPGSGDWSLGASVLPASEPASLDPKRQICFDFTKHQCTRGAACKFSHDINLIIEVNSQERGICFDFLRNTCSRGPLCRFSHDLSNFTPQDVQVSAQAAVRVNPQLAVLGGAACPAARLLAGPSLGAATPKLRARSLWHPEVQAAAAHLTLALPLPLPLPLLCGRPC